MLPPGGTLRPAFDEDRPVTDGERIVAVGLLTQSDLKALGSTFQRAYKIDETPCFGELLRAIDEADRTMRTGRGIEGPASRTEEGEPLKSAERRRGKRLGQRGARS
jgi:hypothetical protein